MSIHRLGELLYNIKYIYEIYMDLFQSYFSGNAYVIQYFAEIS